MRKIWDIPGGVHPPENKHQSVQLPIGTIPLPREIILPLNQHIGAPSEPVVSAGDRVLKGQLIAKPQGVFSAGVHASTSGTVVAVEDRVVPHPSGMTALCVVIEPDGEERWAPLTPCENPDELDHFELVERIRNAGIAGLGGAGFPTAVKVNPRSVDHIDTLIINGTECEPYITADDMLMRERAQDIVAGAQLLARIIGHPQEILVGIEDNKPEAIAAMQKAAEGTPVEIVSFPTKYPSGGERQLIQILTGKEVPSGKLPAHIGIVVQNVGTAAATYRAIRHGEPLISRVTTVVGEALGEQRNIEVLIGTPIDHILELHGFQPKRSSRLIIGGPMMGYAVEQASVPLVKTTNCVLVPSHNEMPEPPPAQACIRCGMCAEACPAGLLPQQLFWYAQAEDHDKLEAHNLFDCIECGACSFVCPSNIPLVQFYRASKGTIRQQNAEKEKADRARKRFEARQERIAKAEAEKEAKRLARKKAAEEAKKQLAKAQPDGEAADKSSTNKQAPDLVAQAMARAKQAQVDPATQKAKLERTLSSAQSRVERAQQQLADAQQEEDSARVETLRARLKQAEQKVQDAENRLKEFASENTVGTESAPNAAPDVGADKARAKVTVSAADAQQKTLETLRKRLATAQTKLNEAEAQGSSTADALRQGVEKLQSKLREAEAAAASSDEQPEANQDKTLSAAEAAIAKAQAKAAAQSSMSDEEKAQAQLEALKKRLGKAQERLAKAEADNDENLEAFRAGVEKLETKLAEMAKK